MNVYEFFNNIYHINNEKILQEIVKISDVRHLKKGQFVIHVGEKQSDIYFLDSGIFRGFFLDLNGKEITDCICYRRGTVAMSSYRMEPNKPSPMAIEVLEDCRFFCLPMSQILDMQRRYIEVSLLYNELLTLSLESNWKMKRILAQYTAIQRYEWFLDEYPGMIDQVNNRYIASFLGMTPVSLSRLRKTIQGRKNIG